MMLQPVARNSSVRVLPLMIAWMTWHQLGTTPAIVHASPSADSVQAFDSAIVIPSLPLCSPAVSKRMHHGMPFRWPDQHLESEKLPLL